MVSILIYFTQLLLIWQSSCNLNGEVVLDDFRNTYVFDAHTIIKYDKDGEQNFTYSNLRNGDITQLDVTNPLRILVYFGDNSEVLFLDNTLTEQQNGLNFNDLEMYDVSLACSSFQNHLWVYRVAEQKLVRLNTNGSIVNESNNVGLWLSDEDQDFIQLKESGNYLYLIADDGTILVFDQYGAYLKKIRLPNTSDLHIVNDIIVFKVIDELKIYNIRLSTEEVLLDLNKTQLSSDQIAYNLTHVCALDDKHISLHSFSRPNKSE